MTIISEEAMALAAHQKAEQNRAGDGHDEARKALADIYGYMLRPGVDYQSGDGTNAPAIIFADADYEVGDGNCGLHEDSKSANEPAIIYVRSDALEAAHAHIAAMRDLLEDIDNQINWEINPSNYDHDDVCQMNSQWCYIGGAVQSALAETPAEATTAFEARIRADERERIASQILPILERDRQAFVDGCTIGGDLSTLDDDDAKAVDEYDTAIRAMKGEGDE